MSDNGTAQNIEERSAKMTLFGQEFRLKDYVCSKNGEPYRKAKKPLSLQLFICPTFYCPGSCPFCAAAANRRTQGFLDIGKLKTVLEGLRDQGAFRNVAITGGEPLTNIVLLDEIVEMIFEILGEKTQLSISTSGIGLAGLEKIGKLKLLDAVHISRHHYDDEKNRAYFGLDVASGEEVSRIVNAVGKPKLFVFNCLLLSDGIGSVEEMIRFLEFTAETGVSKAGFVTPMPVNDYARKNRVSYLSLLSREDERFFFLNGYRDYEYCSCQDAVYLTKKGGLVELYGRESCYGGPDFARGLVYGADNILRDGFGEKARVILKP